MIFRVSLRGTVCLIFLFTFSDETPNICNLPAKVGRCKASFARFYFNKKTGNCEKFTYGGCNGNKNNFVYWYQCRATCLNNGKVETLIFALS